MVITPLTGSGSAVRQRHHTDDAVIDEVLNERRIRHRRCEIHARCKHGVKPACHKPMPATRSWRRHSVKLLTADHTVGLQNICAARLSRSLLEPPASGLDLTGRDRYRRRSTAAVAVAFDVVGAERLLDPARSSQLFPAGVSMSARCAGSGQHYWRRERARYSGPIASRAVFTRSSSSRLGYPAGRLPSSSP